MYETLLGLHPLLFHLLSQRSKETVEEKKKLQNVKNVFHIIKPQRPRNLGPAKRKSPLEERENTLQACCFVVLVADQKMNYPCSYNKFSEMFVLVLLW